jgi:hypothetical protein
MGVLIVIGIAIERSERFVPFELPPTKILKGSEIPAFSDMVFMDTLLLIFQFTALTNTPSGCAGHPSKLDGNEFREGASLFEGNGAVWLMPFGVGQRDPGIRRGMTVLMSYSEGFENLDMYLLLVLRNAHYSLHKHRQQHQLDFS